MLYKVIGGLVAVLVIAVGVWLGVILWKDSQKPDAVASGPGTSAELSGQDGPGGGSGGGGGAPARAAPEQPPYELTVPGELLIADPPQGFADAAEQMGFSIIEVVQLRQLGMRVIRAAAPRGMEENEARRRLAARFPGISIDTHRAFEAQALSDHQNQTARPMAGWPAASASCGGGIRIGQIDSPVDLSHPALKGQRVEFESFHKSSRRPGPADHGTAVATMLVGKPSWGGLLPGAELFAANMFEINEVGKVIGSGIGLLKSIDWLAGKGVQAVNLSVAGGDNKVVRKAFDRARDKGLILVAAAGNWGTDKRPAYPAAYRDVIAVTAIDAKRKPYKKANRGAYIDFAAPGVKIYTAVPKGGRMMTGTSFATPYLTVLLAMHIEAGAPKRSGTLRALLAQRAVDLGDPGKDPVFGYGIVGLRPKCQ